MSKAVEEAKIEEVVEKTAQENKEDVVERPYTLRKLADKDLWSLLQLFRKIGLKDFKDAWVKARETSYFNPAIYESEEERAKALEDFKKETGINLFIDMADIMISKLDTHSDAIYDFYSSLSGIPADEIKEMEFGTLPLMIYDSFSGVKNTAFFKVLFKLL